MTWNKWLSLRRMHKLHDLQVWTHATPGASQNWIKDAERLLPNAKVLHKYTLHKSNAELNRKLSLVEIWLVSKNRRKTKINVNFILQHATKAHRGSRGTALLLLPPALDGVVGQHHGPGKTRCPLYRWLSGSQGRSGQVRKISPEPGFDPRTAHPVASRYTDWAIPAYTKITVHITKRKLFKAEK